MSGFSSASIPSIINQSIFKLWNKFPQSKAVETLISQVETNEDKQHEILLKLKRRVWPTNRTGLNLEFPTPTSTNRILVEWKQNQELGHFVIATQAEASRAMVEAMAQLVNITSSVNCLAVSSSFQFYGTLPNTDSLFIDAQVLRQTGAYQYLSAELQNSNGEKIAYVKGLFYSPSQLKTKNNIGNLNSSVLSQKLLLK